MRGIFVNNIAKTTRQSRVNFAICMVDGAAVDLLETHFDGGNDMLTKDKLLKRIKFTIKNQMFMHGISEKHEKEIQAFGVEHFQNIWSRIFK